MLTPLSITFLPRAATSLHGVSPFSNTNSASCSGVAGGRGGRAWVFLTHQGGWPGVARFILCPSSPADSSAATRSRTYIGPWHAATHMGMASGRSSSSVLEVGTPDDGLTRGGFRVEREEARAV
jgi:hypothetical protein